MRFLRFRRLTLAMVSAISAGCGSVPATNTTLGLTATTVTSHVPSNAIRQVYYLGVFDPRDQVPPTIYRVRAHGQASALARTRFASGWVRAELVDSLSGQVSLPGETVNSGGTGGTGDKGGTTSTVERDLGTLAGRRLVMFGPEGFREAPRNHRLVVVMGSDPEAFFAAVDQALGVVAQVTQGTSAGPEIEKALFADLSAARLLRPQDEAKRKTNLEEALIAGLTALRTYYLETCAAILAVRSSKTPDSLGPDSVITPSAEFVKDKSRRYLQEAALRLNGALFALESGLHVVGDAKAGR